VCNAKYGNNGWLGIASIWISGSHITQGTVKMNDTYFNTATYNKPSWKQMVLCQEIGHTFGLDHQDENFNNQNLGTCMDYSNDPARDDGQGNNLHPNAHDYNQLAHISTPRPRFLKARVRLKAMPTTPTKIGQIGAARYAAPKTAALQSLKRISATERKGSLMFFGRSRADANS
jgi:hypothetical protein